MGGDKRPVGQHDRQNGLIKPPDKSTKDTGSGLRIEEDSTEGRSTSSDHRVGRTYRCRK